MATRKIPTVKIWNVKDPRTTNVVEYLKAKKTRYTPPTENEINLHCNPYRGDDKKAYKAFQRSVETQIAHHAVGGGALIWAKMAGGRFLGGGFFGVGRTVQMASWNCQSGRFDDTVPDERVYFFWVEKVGETNEVEIGKRKVTCFTGKLWMKSGDNDEDRKRFQQVQTLASLRG